MSRIKIFTHYSTTLSRLAVILFWAYIGGVLLATLNQSLFAVLRVRESVSRTLVGDFVGEIQAVGIGEQIQSVFSSLFSELHIFHVVLLGILGVVFLGVALLRSQKTERMVAFGIAGIAIVFSLLMVFLAVVFCENEQCSSLRYVFFFAHIWWLITAGVLPMLYLSSHSYSILGGREFWKAGIYTILGIGVLWGVGTLPLWFGII